MKTYKAYYRKYISPKEWVRGVDLLPSNDPEDVKKHFADKFPFNKVVVTSLERVRNKTEKSNEYFKAKENQKAKKLAEAEKHRLARIKKNERNKKYAETHR